MSDLRKGLLPLLPASYPNYTHGSAQRVGGSESEETVREDVLQYKRRENKAHTPKKGGGGVGVLLLNLLF